ncbi:vomeronasal type-1 receptor 4-like [Octodon degus]|uniref:Vomeronasal type-1 receptor n=1 Tax=Octodon degus TaxID=10160 RepID=A0A6P3FT02_OCTDE|nr:vomeronasal type-1 receptor 4-like [Octodon degus]
MNTVDLIFGLLFPAQTAIGVVGNMFLLIVYSPTSWTGQALQPTHLILTHMAVANFLVLLFKGIPHTMLIWGMTTLLGNVECTLVYYVHRVARGLSLCTTCLLSNVQAITISSRHGRWIRPKDRAWRNISFSCVLCWIFNLLTNTFIPIDIWGLQHTHNSTKQWKYSLCSCKSSETSSKYTFLLTFPDVLFLGLMAQASIYMVLFLYRHQQTVKHIHTGNNSHRFSPEAKATQSIICLASTFILFYLINSMVTIYISGFSKHLILLQHMTAFLAACYPTISPLIVML